MPDTKTVTMRCTFCGKSQHEVEKLIAGPGVFICGECVALCNEILEAESKPATVASVARDPHDVPTNELVDKLRNAGQLAADVDRRLKETVDMLRGRGHTWAQIGEALGTSRQAAWERFSSDD